VIDGGRVVPTVREQKKVQNGRGKKKKNQSWTNQDKRNRWEALKAKKRFFLQGYFQTTPALQTNQERILEMPKKMP